MMNKKKIIMSYVMFWIMFIMFSIVILSSLLGIIACLALSIALDEIRFHMIMFGMMMIIMLPFFIKSFFEEIKDYKKFKYCCQDNQKKNLNFHSK